MDPAGPLPWSQDFATCQYMQHMNTVHTTTSYFFKILFNTKKNYRQWPVPELQTVALILSYRQWP